MQRDIFSAGAVHVGIKTHTLAADIRLEITEQNKLNIQGGTRHP